VTRLALAQLPRRARRRVLIRTDSGGGTHDFLAWLTSPGRRLHYSAGMTITDDMHQAILTLPGRVWEPAYDAGGEVRPGAWVAEANDLWPVLGFAPQGEVRGRSRQRLPLTVWWRDHGHPNLFSATESMGLLRVAVDVNVFLDLESASERHGVIASRALAGDWLTDQLELVVTGELMRELARMPGGQEKSHQHQAASKYTRLAVDGGAAETLARHISEHVLKTQAIDLSVDPADQSDVRHVAEASLAGVTVLATKDDKLLQWAAGAIGITGGLPLPTGLDCCDRALGQHQGAARCGSFGVASPARRSPDVDGRAIQVDQVPPATTSTCTATPRPSGGRGWPANCPAVLSTPGITRPRRRPANWP
jgi:hypothetical protein